MTLDFDTLAILLLAAPFLAAAIAPLVSRLTGRGAGWILAIVPAGLFVALSTLIGAPARFGIDWVPVLGLRLTFLVDGLGLVFALLITGIGGFILVYSGESLRTHPHRGRFLSFLLAFMGAMLGLVLADSLVALFAFWELTSVTSFLLIGFDHARPVARRAAIQALVVTGIGGLALMAGGVLIQTLTGSWDLSAAVAFRGQLSFGPLHDWALGFILVAAFTKSAQLPFHFWLPNAMEAPTPVSAYLHSATMVQAGVYLLARMSPILGGSAEWQVLLCAFGGATLLWGAVMALKQTDLKQMLAQSTIASLGLLVMLLGLGGEGAAVAVAAYFVAHALYKAGLFLIAGIIDHGTGTRDITALGGLRDHLTISFIAAGLAAVSMFGLPPFLGYFAKEAIYAGLGLGDVWGIVALGVLVLGNSLLGAVALALAIGPFMGALKPTPETPHEGGFALWIGPALFGLLGLAVLFALSSYGDAILAPMASAIAGHPVEAHLSLAVDPLGLPIWLSVATWAFAGLVYWRLAAIRHVLQQLGRAIPWSLDRGFDLAMRGLVRGAGAFVRTWQHGRLELYLVMVFAMLTLVLLVPLWTLGGWPGLPGIGHLTFYEWGAIALGAVGAATVVVARTRLGAIVALGIQGVAIALIFLFFGAPDLAFTQLMVETLSVVILALVMTRLHLEARDPRPYEDWLRDGGLAVLAGVAVTALLLAVLEGRFDSRLGDFFARNSVEIAHGHNIVNVILVDFRGLDTLGEISVVMTAGIAILALLHRQHKRQPPKTKRAPRKVTP